MKIKIFYLLLSILLMIVGFYIDSTVLLIIGGFLTGWNIAEVLKYFL